MFQNKSHDCNILKQQYFLVLSFKTLGIYQTLKSIGGMAPVVPDARLQSGPKVGIQYIVYRVASSVYLLLAHSA